MMTDAERAAYRDGFRAGWDDGKQYLFQGLSAIMRAGKSAADDEDSDARKVLEAIIRWEQAGRPDAAQSGRLMHQTLMLQYQDADQVVDASEYVDRRLRELEQGHGDA